MFLVISGGDWLQATASFIGAIIGAVIAVCGVYWQVNVQAKSERKNSFDSAIGVENYKQLFNMANEVNSYADELVNLEFKVDHININELISTINDFDDRFSRSMYYLNNNFYSILTYYGKSKGYKEQFNKLYCKAINNRLNIHSPTEGDQQRIKNNLIVFEEDLNKLGNYMIFVCTEIIK